jgi:hypothetical protein
MYAAIHGDAISLLLDFNENANNFLYHVSHVPGQQIKIILNLKQFYDRRIDLLLQCECNKYWGWRVLVVMERDRIQTPWMGAFISTRHFFNEKFLYRELIYDR